MKRAPLIVTGIILISFLYVPAWGQLIDVKKEVMYPRSFSNEGNVG